MEEQDGSMEELAEFLCHLLTGIFHDRGRCRRVALWGGRELAWIGDEVVESSPATLREFEKQIWGPVLEHYGAPAEEV